MVAALKVDPKRLPKTKKTEQKTGRELTLDMVKRDAPGAPVATYIYPFVKTSGISNNELGKLVGYSSHSNMSMVRSGLAKLPVKKANALAEALHINNKHEFGLLVAENNYPEEVDVLKQMGVIVDKKERLILDSILERVPAGDFPDFVEKLNKLLDEY